MITHSKTCPFSSTVDLPPTVVDQPDDQLNQIPQSNVSFSITATGTEPLSYQWQKDGADLSNTDYIEGVTTTTLVVRDITKADEGAYSCVVTNHVGVDESDAAQMSIGRHNVCVCVCVCVCVSVCVCVCVIIFAFIALKHNFYCLQKNLMTQI